MTEPKQKSKGICELCGDKKHLTTHLETTYRIWTVHKKCWKKAQKTLYAFFKKYGIGDPNFETKDVGVLLIHKWLQRE